MKNMIKKIAMFLFLIIVTCCTFSHAIYGRSVTATAVEKFFELTNAKAPFTVEGYEAFMASDARKEQTYSNVTFDTTFREHTFGQNKIYTINEKEDAEYVVIYLHGGGYVKEASKYQWQLCNTLANNLDATIVYPVYTLAPEGTCEDAYAFLAEMYSEMCNKTDAKIVLMGDSAGAGLAAGFNMYLVENKMKNVDKLVLISPFLDGEVKTVDSKIAKVDPCLDSYGLRQMAKLWAGNLDVSDYKVSPINGNVEGLPEVITFVGTREIFLDDCIAFNAKMKEAGVKSELVVGEGLNHDYVLHPTIEARKAESQIITFIKK